MRGKLIFGTECTLESAFLCTGGGPWFDGSRHEEDVDGGLYAECSFHTLAGAVWLFVFDGTLWCIRLSNAPAYRLTTRRLKLLQREEHGEIALETSMSGT